MIESPFNHEDNPKEFQRWIDEYGADLRVVVCTVDEQERERRHVTRARHPGHHDKERLNHYPFHKMEFDYSVMPGKKLVLDMSEPLLTLVEKVINFVG